MLHEGLTFILGRNGRSYRNHAPQLLPVMWQRISR